MNSTEASAGSQFSPIRSTTLRTGSGISAGTGRSSSSRTNHAASSPVVETMRRRIPGRALFGVDLLDYGERVGDVGAAPAAPRLGHLEIASRRRLPAAHPDPRRLEPEETPGLVLGEDAGDVV